MKVNSGNNNGKTEGRVGKDGVTTFKELKVVAAPVAVDDVANKAYVDKVAITDKYLPGDILIRPTAPTPTGFLKCNGAEVAKTMYPALYAAIGEAHNTYSTPGVGIPWQNQYGINPVIDLPLDDWASGNNLSASNMGFQVAVTNNRVYIFGRNNNSTTSTSAIYTTTINSDGTLNSWSTSSVTLPAGITRSQIFVYLSKLYVIGGNNNTNQAVVWRSTIATDGTLSTFTTLTALPFTVVDHQIVLVQNKIFIFGGTQGGVASAAVQCATIDATTGNIGTWTNASNNAAILSLPTTLTNHGITMINRRVYVFGGMVGGSTATANVYYSEFGNDDKMGVWTAAPVLPETVYNAMVITTTDKVYVMGGVMSGAYSSKMYFANINSDGSLSGWNLAGALPDTLASARAIVTGGKLHILGGYKGSLALTSTYYVTMPGGLNDYTSYYNGAVTTTASANFRLPDYTKSDNKTYYFIKY